MKEIGRTYRAMDAWLQRKYGLTVTRMDLLRSMLDHYEQGHAPMTVGEAAEAIGCATSTMTPVVDGLVRDRWVRRERSEEDRRVVRLILVDPEKVAFASMRLRSETGAAPDVVGQYLREVERHLSEAKPVLNVG